MQPRDFRLVQQKKLGQSRQQNRQRLGMETSSGRRSGTGGLRPCAARNPTTLTQPCPYQPPPPNTHRRFDTVDIAGYFYIFRNMDISSRQLTTAYLAALGSEYRMRLVELLAAGERCVCELAPHFPTSFSVVSHHLSVLEQAGIIVSRRDGRGMRYRLADESVLEFLDQARQLAKAGKPGRCTARRPKGSERTSCSTSSTKEAHR